MDISRYVGYFHDGAIYDICHAGNQMIITMGSAEIVDEEIAQNIPLSKDNTIEGRLHIEGVRSLSIGEKTVNDKFKMLSKSSDIFHFEIIENIVIFNIIWLDFSRTDLPTREVGFSVVEIEAEKIWWENLPEMVVD